MKKIGTYKIEASFNISGRGIAVVCQLVDGTVRTGSFTKIEFDGAYLEARIIGVYMPKLGEDEIWRWGFLLKFEDTRLIERIASEKLQEQVIEIFVQE